MRPGPLSVTTFLLSLSAATIGCGTDDDSVPPSNISAGEFLASITVAPDHRVYFFKGDNGGLGTFEEARVGVLPVLSSADSRSATDLFKALAPNRDVPVALAQAVAQLDSGTRHDPTTARSLPRPSTLPGGAGAAPQFYDAGEQSWFSSTFCVAGGTVPAYPDTPASAPRVCWQGGTWAHAGWTLENSEYYYSWTTLGQEATADALFQGADNSCPWYDPWCGGTNRWMANIPPGWWNYGIWDEGTSAGEPDVQSFSSSIDNGNGATVSIADRQRILLCSRHYNEQGPDCDSPPP
jgi:hypothetical protein